MLPFFASTAHRAYTKCVSWFVQEMDELDKYTLGQFSKDHFVVRRSLRPYAGVSVEGEWRFDAR